MDKQIILIAEEFPAHPGGVAHFSDTLAGNYHQKGLLKGVISLSPFRAASRSFPVVQVRIPSRNYGHWPLDKIVFFRKINSLLFKLFRSLRLLINHPVVGALKRLNYNPQEDILFYTYQVHHPDIIGDIHDQLKGSYWVLYHGLDIKGFVSNKSVINQAVKNAEKILFNSKATQTLHAKLGYEEPVNSQVIYPTLDVDYLKSFQLLTVSELEERTNISLRGFVLITTICRLVRRKGIHFAIEIFADLEQQFPGKYKYVIGGDGPEKESLMAIVKGHQLEAQVHFLGYVDEQLKYSLLNQSHVFLMPNFDDGGEDFEGFGISFLEAGYFDNLVIGGKDGGAGEALQFVANGLQIDLDQQGKKKAIDKIQTQDGR